MLLITGANGQLGRCLHDLLGEKNVLYTDAAELDITNAQAVRTFGAAHPLTGIINCAAYTNVDKAEDEPALARKINAEGPANLADLAAAQNIPLIHISTDYVFDGTAHSPLPENASVNPLGVYGKTKQEGEKEVLARATTAVIIRTAWLYSPYGKNFLKTMAALGAQKDELRVVADQFGTPTYAPHLAQAVLKILPQIKTGQKEIYHFTDEGAATWYDFAHYILKNLQSPCCVLPITTREYPTKATRPAFSVLDKSKIKQAFNLNIPHWTQGVEECLTKLF
uniref:dTDP-4-dehydrorhamnose reductase n=1 Tax=uncultured Elusimicrobia bacterium TaxID=699876 RepID=A0A650EP69_9BACT|nr:NAD(P)-dependent oxidoreductase [uncultured Elusimicrobia bacterium]